MSDLPKTTGGSDDSPREERCDVFISAASEDYSVALAVDDHLRRLGVRSFFCERTLDEIGDARYARAISEALRVCRHLIVVTSNGENPSKRWVEEEWSTYHVEQMSGRKSGNLLVLACGRFSSGELPLFLRKCQMLLWPDHKDKLIAYLSGKGGPMTAHDYENDGGQGEKAVLSDLDRAVEESPPSPVPPGIWQGYGRIALPKRSMASRAMAWLRSLFR